jgi:hypothetical protein
MQLTTPQLTEDPIELGWWVEVITEMPLCTYYFGDFDSQEKAEWAKGFYVDELAKDGAEGISTQLKHCQAQDLTNFEDESRSSSVIILPPTIKWRSRSQPDGVRYRYG